MERNTHIIFEQPLNENVRICLRLEYLFAQVEHYLKKEDVWDVYQALNSILQLMTFLDRPDIKTKLSNALIQEITAVTNHQHSDEAHQKKLKTLADQLTKAKNTLHNIRGKFAPSLYDTEFLATIKKRIVFPAGTCNYALPELHLWLQKPYTEQRQTLQEWFNHFVFLQEVVNLLLNSVRNSSQTTTKLAKNGFYQDTLDSNVNYQLIRVTLPVAANIYPEVSLGRHRLSIYFYEFGTDPATKNKQIDYDVNFQLQLGKI